MGGYEHAWCFGRIQTEEWADSALGTLKAVTAFPCEDAAPHVVGIALRLRWMGKIKWKAFFQNILAYMSGVQSPEAWKLLLCHAPAHHSALLKLASRTAHDPSSVLPLAMMLALKDGKYDRVDGLFHRYARTANDRVVRRLAPIAGIWAKFPPGEATHELSYDAFPDIFLAEPMLHDSLVNLTSNKFCTLSDSSEINRARAQTYLALNALVRSPTVAQESYVTGLIPKSLAVQEGGNSHSDEVARRIDRIGCDLLLCSRQIECSISEYLGRSRGPESLQLSLPVDVNTLEKVGATLFATWADRGGRARFDAISEEWASMIKHAGKVWPSPGMVWRQEALDAGARICWISLSNQRVVYRFAGLFDHLVTTEWLIPDDDLFHCLMPGMVEDDEVRTALPRYRRPLWPRPSEFLQALIVWYRDARVELGLSNLPLAHLRILASRLRDCREWLDHRFPHLSSEEQVAKAQQYEKAMEQDGDFDVTEVSSLWNSNQSDRHELRWRNANYLRGKNRRLRARIDLEDCQAMGLDLGEAGELRDDSERCSDSDSHSGSDAD